MQWFSLLAQQAAEKAPETQLEVIYNKVTDSVMGISSIWWLTLINIVVVVVVLMRQKKIAQNQVDLAKMVEEAIKK